MKKVLTLAAERLAGSGGEPVIGLQTAFGGGKTHTMLAIWHLAGVSDPRSLAGADAVVSEAVARAWKPAQRYVLVGTGIGAKAMPNNERIGWGEQRGECERGGFRRGDAAVRIGTWSTQQRFASGLPRLVAA